MKSLLKIFLFLTILICNYSILNAQSVVWRQILGGQYNELGYDVIELRDKGFLMVGTKEIIVSGTGFLTVQSYLVRLDKTGNIIWQRTIGDSINPNTAVSVIEDPYGNIYVPHQVSSTAHLIKMNSAGIILWNKDYGNYNIERFAGISFINNFRNFLLLGKNEISQNLTTASLTKLDTSGNLVWSRAYFDSIPSLSVYRTYHDCFLFLENSYFFTGGKGLNGFIIKTDTSGNIIWDKRFLQSQLIYSIAANSANTFIATGLGINFATYCLKYDNNGDTLWTKNFGLDSANYYGYKKITKTYGGNFAIGTSAGENVNRIGIIDSLGNIKSIYTNVYPENVLISQENLNPTSDSGLVLTGYYGIFPKGTKTASVITDVLVFKVDKNGTMVAIKNNNEIIADNFEINTFPNPYNLSFKLSFNLSKTSKVKVELYDLSGKKIREIENKSLNSGNHQYLINTPELSSGIYFLRFDTGGEVYSKKVLLVK